MISANGQKDILKIDFPMHFMFIQTSTGRILRQFFKLDFILPPQKNKIDESSKNAGKSA